MSNSTPTWCGFLRRRCDRKLILLRALAFTLRNRPRLLIESRECFTGLLRENPERPHAVATAPEADCPRITGQALLRLRARH